MIETRKRGGLGRRRDRDARGAAAVFAPWQRVGLLIAFAALTVARLPQVWLHGRFQGEEGTVFLAFAWHRPAAEALWRSFAGYLNIGANGATLLLAQLLRAGWISLEHAPWVTMGIGLAFQCVPAICLLWGRAAWLADWRAVIAALLIIVTAPMTEEVYANVLHIQYHLALACGLILALEVPRGRAGQALSLLPLLLGPLCGPGAILFLPLFAARALIDRDRVRLGQTLALGCASAIQMLLFYTHSATRGQPLGWDVLANMLFVRLAVMPYLTVPVATHLGIALHLLRQTGGAVWWGMTALSCGWFAVLFGIVVAGGIDAATWLLLAGLTVAVATFGMGMIATPPALWFDVWILERYDFLPLTLMGMSMVALAMRPRGRFRRVAATLCAMSLLSGAMTFPMPIDEIAHGPDWAAEVALWRRDHRHLMVAWDKLWLVDLSDGDRPCHPPDPAHPHPDDPRWCESSWQSRVLWGVGVRPKSPG